MRLFLLAISVLWLLIRLTAITNPLKIKKLYSRMITRAKVLFFLPLIAGMLFLWARPASSLQPLISVLAGISFLKGLFLLVCPNTLLKSFFNRILSFPLVFYRAEGVFIVGLGVAVIFSIL